MKLRRQQTGMQYLAFFAFIVFVSAQSLPKLPQRFTCAITASATLQNPVHGNGTIWLDVANHAAKGLLLFV